MPTKAPVRKKVAKKVIKKMVARAKTKSRVVKAVKKMKAAPARRSSSAGGKMKITGRVIHFYDKICVAIVELAVPLKVGDTVMFKHGAQEWVQRINSMQVDHEAVKTAKKKQVVGVKVDRPIHDGSVVMPA